MGKLPRRKRDAAIRRVRGVIDEMEEGTRQGVAERIARVKGLRSWVLRFAARIRSKDRTAGFAPLARQDLRSEETRRIAECDHDRPLTGVQLFWKGGPGVLGALGQEAVSYTHLTLPTKRIV